VKIDGQFVRDVVDDPLDEAAVRCFAEVARVVGVKTVAEFVDRPEVLVNCVPWASIMLKGSCCTVPRR